jgi:hypothetical protein
MMLADAVKKIQGAGMQVLLDAAKPGGENLSGLLAYAWSDQNGYECYLTVPFGIQDRLNEDEVEVLERVISNRGPDTGSFVRMYAGTGHNAA